MVPDFDIGITVLVAGKPEIIRKMIDAVGTTIVRAAEEVTTRQLQERYVGTYESTNATLNSSITLVADGRGLVVEKFISNERTEVEGSIWYDYCITNLDLPMYAGMAYNELVFWDKEKDGKYGTVELSAFRVNLTRTEKDEGLWQDKQEFLEL